MHLEIITPDKKVFVGEVDGVKLPGTSGSFEVLNRHASLISTLSKGEVSLRSTEELKKSAFMIEGGIVEVLDNKVTVLAEAVIEPEGA